MLDVSDMATNLGDHISNTCQFYQVKSTLKTAEGGSEEKKKSSEAYIFLEEKYLCTDRPVILWNNIHDSFIGAQPSPSLFLCGEKKG